MGTRQSRQARRGSVQSLPEKSVSFAPLGHSLSGGFFYAHPPHPVGPSCLEGLMRVKLPGNLTLLERGPRNSPFRQKAFQAGPPVDGKELPRGGATSYLGLVHGGGSRRPVSSLVPLSRQKAWSREFLALTLVARRLAPRRDPVWENKQFHNSRAHRRGFFPATGVPI